MVGNQITQSGPRACVSMERFSSCFITGLGSTHLVRGEPSGSRSLSERNFAGLLLLDVPRLSFVIIIFSNFQMIAFASVFSPCTGPLHISIFSRNCPRAKSLIQHSKTIRLVTFEWFLKQKIVCSCSHPVCVANFVEDVGPARPTTKHY